MSETATSGQSTTLLGESLAFRDMLAHVSALAVLNRPVLILGERGAGKELIAHRLMYLSPRWNRPFVTLNCGALAETLLDSELFGHEAGAFTGAGRRRLSRFELADTGTLFLDEVGNAPDAVQEKLLRLIEYGSFERVGGNQTVRVDVRLIAAHQRRSTRPRRGAKLSRRPPGPAGLRCHPHPAVAGAPGRRRDPGPALRGADDGRARPRRVRRLHGAGGGGARRSSLAPATCGSCATRWSAAYIGWRTAPARSTTSCSTRLAPPRQCRGRRRRLQRQPRRPAPAISGALSMPMSSFCWTTRAHRRPLQPETGRRRPWAFLPSVPQRPEEAQASIFHSVSAHPSLPEYWRRR